ncbi:MAG: hypothetical protein IMZ46_05210 [Acidobacteria bacterium]|nr:hypothetical protein [Acidobacteriota bacterium]
MIAATGHAEAAQRESHGGATLIKGAARGSNSVRDSEETILRVHLVPLLGTRKLDAIRTEDVVTIEAPWLALFRSPAG